MLVMEHPQWTPLRHCLLTVELAVVPEGCMYALGSDRCAVGLARIQAGQPCCSCTKGVVQWYTISRKEGVPGPERMGCIIAVTEASLRLMSSSSASTASLACNAACSSRYGCWLFSSCISLWRLSIWAFVRSRMARCASRSGWLQLSPSVVHPVCIFTGPDASKTYHSPFSSPAVQELGWRLPSTRLLQSCASWSHHRHRHRLEAGDAHSLPMSHWHSPHHRYRRFWSVCVVTHHCCLLFQPRIPRWTGGGEAARPRTSNHGAGPQNHLELC
jgi:hypothetical protein